MTFICQGRTTNTVTAYIYIYICDTSNTRRLVTHRHSHLPQWASLRSGPPRLVFDMPPLDATGGWQVAAGRGGPWWCCWDYCCTTITSPASSTQHSRRKQDHYEGTRRKKHINYGPKTNKRKLVKERTPRQTGLLGRVHLLPTPTRWFLLPALPRVQPKWLKMRHTLFFSRVASICEKKESSQFYRVARKPTFL